MNLLDNENKVQVEALQDGSKEGINIKITFIEDGAERFVKMIQLTARMESGFRRIMNK